MKKYCQNLSEDTRIQTINLINEVYDLHFTNGWYYICEHGKLSFVATMTKEIYDKMFE